MLPRFRERRWEVGWLHGRDRHGTAAGARLLLAGALVLAACTQTGNRATPQAVEPGGVLRVAMVNANSTLMDPQRDYALGGPFGLFRCCLLRTLLSYDGRSGDNGGSILRPDLATGMPDVSTDGLTWTFTLRTGINYAPPLQDTQIQAQDFVRALERTAKFGSYRFYYSQIVGFDRFANGDSATISGLSTPDPSTLVITLIKPYGDLGYTLSLPAAAPIPADPTNQGAELGVATGHDLAYGAFLVASGPYMFAGSQALDPSAPASAQRPVSGFVPGRSMVLVRNPSWHRTTDPLRAAYPDEIDVIIGGTVTAAYDAVRAGRLDLVLDSSPDTPQLLQSILTDPALRRRTHENPSYVLEYLTMNLAVPPFDDLHVRKAVSFAIDKDRFVQAWGGVALARPATHLVPDDLESGLLSDYDPYFSVGHHGDLARAQAEMRRSRYDTNGDGVCDAAACKSVRFPAVSSGWGSSFGEILKEQLAPIGIALALQPQASSSVQQHIEDLSQHTPLGISGYAPDFLSPSNFLEPFLSWTGNPIARFDFSLIGASPADLRRFGYGISHVPSLGTAIAACVGVAGDASIPCWTGIDATAMEHVLPIVPLFFKSYVRIVSARVAAFSWDQSTSYPELDRIALKPGVSSAGVVAQASPPSCGPSPIPAGTYVTRITKQDRPPPAAGGSAAVGVFSLRFGGADLAACLHASLLVVRSGAFKGATDVLPYTIEGSEITFGDTSGGCQGVFGIYRWKVRGDSLTFRVVDDKGCPARAFVDTAHPFIRQG